MDNRIDRSVEVPKNFYNVQSILDVPPPKGENVKLLPKIFPKEMLREEMNKDKYVPIPEEVRKEMMQYSPNNSGQKYKARKVPTADKECQNIVQTRECVTKKLQTKNHINANVHKR